MTARILNDFILKSSIDNYLLKQLGVKNTVYCETRRIKMILLGKYDLSIKITLAGMVLKPSSGGRGRDVHQKRISR
jgi:hypothetical protein